jgi:TonB family protein
MRTRRHSIPISIFLIVAGLAACAPASPPAGPAPAAAEAGGRVHVLSEVDEFPELLNREVVRAETRANYPSVLRAARIEGTVTVEFVVGTTGEPERATIRPVNATHDGFREGAERVVARMRFSPAKIGGRPVRAQVTLPISFIL